MPRRELGFGMVDCDNHFYDAQDCLTRHLDPAFRSRVHWMTNERGHRKIVIDRTVYEYIANHVFDPVAVPGALVEMYRHEKTREQLARDPLAGDRQVVPLSTYPETQDRDLRVAKLDAQGVDQCVMFPTLVNGLEELMKHDVELTYGVLDAYNRWLVDDWPPGYKGRLWTMPIVSLVDPDRAVEQVRFAAEHGARAVNVRTGPVPCVDGYRSPGDSRFDVVWQALVENDMGVAYHSSDSGYSDFLARWRADVDGALGASSIASSTYSWVNGAESGRGIEDTVAALIVHGVFTRYPQLRVLSVENGSDWVEPLLRRLAKNWHHYPGRFSADPVAQLRQNLWLSPFWEEDLPALAQLVPLTRICAGSDWPHPEGLPEPTEYVDGLGAFEPDGQRLILRDNGLAFLGLS